MGAALASICLLRRRLSSIKPSHLSAARTSETVLGERPSSRAKSPNPHTSPRVHQQPDGNLEPGLASQCLSVPLSASLRWGRPATGSMSRLVVDSRFGAAEGADLGVVLVRNGLRAALGWASNCAAARASGCRCGRGSAPRRPGCSCRYGRRGRAARPGTPSSRPSRQRSGRPDWLPPRRPGLR